MSPELKRFEIAGITLNVEPQTSGKSWIITAADEVPRKKFEKVRDLITGELSQKTRMGLQESKSQNRLVLTNDLGSNPGTLTNEIIHTALEKLATGEVKIAEDRPPDFSSFFKPQVSKEQAVSSAVSIVDQFTRKRYGRALTTDGINMLAGKLGPLFDQYAQTEMVAQKLVEGMMQFLDDQMEHIVNAPERLQFMDEVKRALNPQKKHASQSKR